MTCRLARSIRAAFSRDRPGELCPIGEGTMSKEKSLEVIHKLAISKEWHKVSLRDFERYSRSQAVYPVDYVIVAGGRFEPIFATDYKIVHGRNPTLCPHARPDLQPRLLAEFVNALRKRRLIRKGETIHFVGRQAKLEEVCGCDLDAVQAEADKPRDPVTKRRRGATRKPTPLTEKQTEALYLVEDHKGNISAAARAAGKSYQVMQRLYEKALRKLGRTATRTLTQRLPTDRRGQVNLATVRVRKKKNTSPPAPTLVTRV
jgi:hypothetical protein